MADNMTPEIQKKGIPLVAKVGSALGAAALTGAIIYGVTRPPEVQSVVPPTPSAAAASPTPPEKTVIPTPTGKVEVTIPPVSASPTSEVKKEVPCLVLEQKYCDQVEVIRVKNAQGQEFTFIVGNLPPGTPISAPFDGQVATGKINQPSPYQGFAISMSDHGVIWNFRGDFKPLATSAKQGATIATMTDTGAKSFNGTYNFVFDIQKPNADKTNLETAEDIEKQLFPAAFTKPIKTASYTGNPATTTLIVFEDNH